MRKATMMMALAFAILGAGRALADSYGCDSGASFLSCSNVGACCDQHDSDFAKYGCTGGWSPGSWSCAFNPFATTPASCIDNGGTYTPANGYCYYPSSGTGTPTCSGDNPADATSNCTGADYSVVKCMLNGVATGDQPGASTCCQQTDYTSCGCPRNAGDAGGDCQCQGTAEQCQPPDQPCGAVGADGRCDNRDPPPPPDPNNPDPNNPNNPDPNNPNNPNPPQWPHKPGYPLPCLLCWPLPGWPPFPPFNWPLFGPIDPNELVGPTGVGANNQVPVNVAMAYQIKFENVGNATAQEIVISDQLSSELDWTTLRFTTINYGGRKVDVPAGSQSLTTVDLPPVDGCVLAGNGPLGVQVALAFNSSNGTITLDLKAIDTTTNTFPADALAGILPPSTTCTSGSLEFTVMPIAADGPGTVITNQASIVFDSNAPIATNVVSNTIGP